MLFVHTADQFPGAIGVVAAAAVFAQNKGVFLLRFTANAFGKAFAGFGAGVEKENFLVFRQVFNEESFDGIVKSPEVDAGGEADAGDG